LCLCLLWRMLPPPRQRLCGRCCLSVILSLFVRDCCKSHRPISLKLIWPTDHKNWLTFGGDPILDMDSGSLSYFSHSCRIRDLKRFISISLMLDALAEVCSLWSQSGCHCNSVVKVTATFSLDWQWHCIMQVAEPCSWAWGKVCMFCITDFVDWILTKMCRLSSV